MWFQVPKKLLVRDFSLIIISVRKKAGGQFQMRNFQISWFECLVQYLNQFKGKPLLVKLCRILNFFVKLFLYKNLIL